jgi:Protein of unknown function (DUF3768)
VLRRVRTYVDFTPENDPYGEHDSGSFELAGHKFLWKIDYYDKSMTIFLQIINKGRLLLHEASI